MTFSQFTPRAPVGRGIVGLVGDGSKGVSRTKKMEPFAENQLLATAFPTAESSRPDHLPAVAIERSSLLRYQRAKLPASVADASGSIPLDVRNLIRLLPGAKDDLRLIVDFY